MRASRNLHNTMFSGVTRANMYFFHTNPSGRILNRFSKDMGSATLLNNMGIDLLNNNFTFFQYRQVDEILPLVMIDTIQIYLLLIGVIIVIAIVNYYYILPTIVFGIIFYFLRAYYLSASKNIKRIEAISKIRVFFLKSYQSLKIN